MTAEAAAPTTTRAAAEMGAATAVSRLAGFVRVLVIAGVLGTTALGNAFGSSNSVSNVLFELLAAGALSAVLVPTFVTRFAEGRDADCTRLARGLMGYAVVALGLVSVVGVIAAPWIARLLTTGTDPAVAASQRELTTYLLRFFVPQVVLYGFGAVATAVLYARRRFTVTAIAPVGNTIVIVACLLVFRVAAGSDPGLDLTRGERLLLAVAGTGGVIAFVGILIVACVRSGTSLVPQWRRGDHEVRGLLAHAGWGTMLHAAAGMLLGAALVAGNSVAGGVVAYQTAFVFFLAPYAVFAQPLHTAVLPDLALHGHDGDHRAFTASVHDTIRRIAIFVAPVSVGLVVAARPAMQLVTFGLDDRGVSLIAAALAGLAVGLLPYSLFLLCARALYALGDSRTPAFVAVAAGLLGVAVMAVGGVLTHDNARVGVMGLGHSGAYAVGAIALAALLAHRVGHLRVVAATVEPVLVATAIGVPVWLTLQALAPRTRAQCAVALTVTLGLGLLAYVAVVRTAARRSSRVIVPDAP